MGRGTEWSFVNINEKPKYDSYIVLIMMETKLPCDSDHFESYQPISYAEQLQHKICRWSIRMKFKNAVILWCGAREQQGGG